MLTKRFLVVILASSSAWVQAAVLNMPKSYVPVTTPTAKQNPAAEDNAKQVALETEVTTVINRCETLINSLNLLNANKLRNTQAYNNSTSTLLLQQEATINTKLNVIDQEFATNKNLTAMAKILLQTTQKFLQEKAVLLEKYKRDKESVNVTDKKFIDWLEPEVTGPFKQQEELLNAQIDSAKIQLNQAIQTLDQKTMAYQAQMTATINNQLMTKIGAIKTAAAKKTNTPGIFK